MRKIMFAFLGALTLAAAVQPAQAAEEIVKGEVRKIDASAGKITLRHGPIKKFDMDDGMTMVFRVKDPAMLGKVKVGDKVNFEADKINGRFTVTKIEKAK
jgi:Cu(I)/Ag(I) efflux system protein CusF